MKKPSLLKNIASNMKRKATNSAKQTIYIALWREKPPKGKRII